MSASADAGSAAAAAAADAADTAASTGTAGDVIDTNGVSVISSLCVACEARGETRLLLLKIPFFRDIILAAFSCEACGEQHDEAAPRQGRGDWLQSCCHGASVLTKATVAAAGTLRNNVVQARLAIAPRPLPLPGAAAFLTLFHRRRAQQRGADGRVRARRRHL